MRLIQKSDFRGPVLVLTLALAFALSVSCAPDPQAKREITCKTPTNEAPCYWIHGRLEVANGNPTIRVWKIGTHRILGILSGPGSLKRNPNDGVEAKLPPNVDRALSKSAYGGIFGDFEVCPLEPEVAGTMQTACIESAKNIVVDQ